MYADQHIHTFFSADSDTPPERQIEQAIALGMRDVCITDHHDYDMISDVDFNLDIPQYLDHMEKLRRKYSSLINIRIGVELGLQEHISDYLYRLTGEYGFDLIIGSVHCIDGFDPYYPEYFEKYGERSYERYFNAVLENIKKIKCYDSLGHLDYIARYGVGNGYAFDVNKYTELIDEILKTVVSEGKALECNCGGYASPLDRSNPGAEVFRRYRELGGELITIGSDAHSPDRLGGGFERAGQLLKDCGFKYYFIYENRVPSAAAL